MWLVADSGSTKTEWVLFDSHGIKGKTYSSGLNPLFISSEDIMLELQKSIPKQWSKQVTQLWFYSAGCSSTKMMQKTVKCLKIVFKEALITVDSDLMAAARATCGNKEGLVAILGTGSNTCYYDGIIIKNHIKSLGYILGDEGSGAAMGKALLKKLLRSELPFELSNAIYADIGMNYDEIIVRIYDAGWANRFLASCTKILHTYREVPEIKQIIKEELNLIIALLMQYKIDVKINFVGSVAFYFQVYLKELLVINHLNLGVIVQSPTEALVNYHLNNL